MKKKNLYWLVESAVMIALAAVLELVAKMIIPELPFGGQVTIVSMLPVILVGTTNCLNSMIENNKTQLRYSALKHFMLDN